MEVGSKLTDLQKEVDSDERVQWIAANRQQRCQWWKAKVLEDSTDQLWCVAGYTYSTELAKKADENKWKCTFEEIVPREFQQYAKVFSEAEFECLSEHKSYDHAINLKPETPKTIWLKVYPMPVNKQEELDRFLDKNLHKKYILLSKSPIALPVFFIKKKDRRLCLVQDYCKLNNFTIKNCYSLPLASDIINWLHQACIFTKFKICWSYNNIQIKAGDK